ncbi:F0F1 ATP synthase subunit A [Treponema primitia]|uniref:F0F1 ATP synthase subunit A n=1 Tax=Treponema primitia TaxID=88058 RepID=UPI00397FBC44
MDALEIKTIFTISFFGTTLPITETVIISWVVMAILIICALVFTRKFTEIPKGPQAILETMVEFLNSFAKDQFGSWSKYFGYYMGTLFLFLLLANIIGVLSPVEISFMGREFIPPFTIAPPTKDINVTASLAVLTILGVLVFGIIAKGPLGWFKHLLHPMAFMLPFNLMEYGTRLLSLSLRLFGNIMGGYVLMHMIEGLLPLGLPMIASLYFDFFDGLIQAAIFVFLSSMYLSEALKTGHEEE